MKVWNGKKLKIELNYQIMERERFKICINSGEWYATFAVNWLSVTAEMISTLLYNYLLLFLGFRAVLFL